jgi:hypothetical protein
VTFGEAAQLMTALAAVLAVALSYINGRKIQDVHLSINSRMDQLLAATQSAAEAKGAQNERDKIVNDT